MRRQYDPRVSRPALLASRSPLQSRLAVARRQRGPGPPAPALGRGHRRAAVRPGGVCGPRRRRAARARRRLDRVPRAGARVARPRPCRLLPRRPRRRRRPPALDEPAETTIYVSLPPPAAPQRRPLPVAIVGPGLPGPAHLGLDEDRRPRLARRHRAHGEGDRRRQEAADPLPRRRARAGDARTARPRLARAHDARTGATLVLVGWLVAFSALGILARARRSPGGRPCSSRRSRSPPRSLLRGVGVDDPTTVVARARGRHRRRRRSSSASARRSCPLPSRAFSPLFLVVLVAWPDVNALAAIGPHPDGGGRFYGVTNQVETLLLAPSLAAAASARRCGCGGDRPAAARHRRLEPGRRRRWRDRRRRGGVGRAARRPRAHPPDAGARRARRRRRRRPGLAIVGVDALLGGSSHVTDAVGGGPGTLSDDLDRRLRISWNGATSAAHTTFLCLLSLGGLAWLGIRGRRRPSVLALLVGIGGLAARQRHARRRARLRRAGLPRTHRLGGDARARGASASAAPLRAAFQSRDSTPRIDRSSAARLPARGA